MQCHNTLCVWSDAAVPYDWLTQSSLDTYAGSYGLTVASQSQADSSLLFTIGKSRLKGAASRKSPGAEFGRKCLGAAGGSTDQVDGPHGEYMVPGH